MLIVWGRQKLDATIKLTYNPEKKGVILWHGKK